VAGVREFCGWGGLGCHGSWFWVGGGPVAHRCESPTPLAGGPCRAESLVAPAPLASAAPIFLISVVVVLGVGVGLVSLGVRPAGELSG
jgi:hypothetical protein